MRVYSKGEIATPLVVVSLLATFIGLLVGSRAVRLQQNPFTQAQQQQCSYETYVHVYKETRGQFFTGSEAGSMRAINDMGMLLHLNEENKSKSRFVTPNLIFDPTRRTNYAEDDPATVKLDQYDRDNWKIKEVFCDSEEGSVRGCPTESEIAQLNNDITAGTNIGNVIGDFRVNCGVELTYGWVLERVSDPSPTTAPTVAPTSRPGDPTLTPAPTRRPTVVPTARPTVQPGPSTGGLEVRVVALNYPQKTPYWDSDHVANFRPASCRRQDPARGEDLRSLYESPFEATATCVGGGCTVGRVYRDEVEKFSGYATFTGLQPGEYDVSVKEIDERGFEPWTGCEDVRWTVSAGQVNQNGIMILQNYRDGHYERRNTESLCKNDDGEPNLIEDMLGRPDNSNVNLCYLKDGSEPTRGPAPTHIDPQPEPTDPPPSPEGNFQILLIDRDGVDGAIVYLEPCPEDDACQKTVRFDNEEDNEYWVYFNADEDIRYNVKVRALSQSITNNIRRCGNGWIVIPSNTTEYCQSKPPGHIRMFIDSGSYVDPISGPGTDPAPSPQPPARPVPPGDPAPPRSGERPPGSGTCTLPGNTTAFERNCSVETMRDNFGDLGEKVVYQASQICWGESRGDPGAINPACLRTGPNCFNADGSRNSRASNCNTYEYSVGLFQFNTINTGRVCVQGLYDGLSDYYARRQTGQRSCSLRSDTASCIRDLKNPVINRQVARELYNQRGWSPWGYYQRVCNFQ